MPDPPAHHPRALFDEFIPLLRPQKLDFTVLLRNFEAGPEPLGTAKAGPSSALSDARTSERVLVSPRRSRSATSCARRLSARKRTGRCLLRSRCGVRLALAQPHLQPEAPGEGRLVRRQAPPGRGGAAAPATGLQCARPSALSQNEVVLRRPRGRKRPPRRDDARRLACRRRVPSRDSARTRAASRTKLSKSRAWSRTQRPGASPAKSAAAREGPRGAVDAEHFDVPALEFRAMWGTSRGSARALPSASLLGAIKPTEKAAARAWPVLAPLAPICRRRRARPRARECACSPTTHARNAPSAVAPRHDAANPGASSPARSGRDAQKAAPRRRRLLSVSSRADGASREPPPAASHDSRAYLARRLLSARRSARPVRLCVFRSRGRGWSTPSCETVTSTWSKSSSSPDARPRAPVDLRLPSR